jgi:hypothetical protein
MNRLLKLFRTALLMIAMAGAAAGGTIGSAQARPKQCNTFAKFIKHDNDMIQYWAQAANAAFAASAWDEYQYDVSQYKGYVYSLATDAKNASELGC